MNIQLTGTGASQNIPAFRCSCAVCSQARDSGIERYRRRNSNAVVTFSSGGKVLIDSPPQFLSQLEAFSVNDKDISSLFLTHRHEDHLLGLFYLFSLKTSKGAVVENPLDIYLGPATKEYLFRNFSSLSNPEKLKQLEGVFRFIDIRRLEEFFIGDISVVPLETNHLKIKSPSPSECIEETFGFCIREGGKNFYYLVDAAEKLPEDTVLYMKKNRPDCIVIDCTYGEADSCSGHGDIESVIALRKEFPDGDMVISHIGHKNHPPDILETILSPSGIHVGYDGMSINL